MKKYWLFLLSIVVAVSVAGCGTNASSSAGEKKEKDVQTIVVGTGTQFPNICFIDDKGKLTGYDVEVVRAIDKELKDYKFEFKTMEFSNLLLSLESNKIDMIAHNMAQNAERKKKFLFNDETYNYSPLYVTVPKNRNDIHSLKDLEGKKMIVGATSNAAVYLDKYNQKHGNKIDVIYAGQGADDATTQLKTGRADATLATPFSIDFSNQALKFQQKTVGDIVINSKVYFMFNKKDEKLKSEVDQAIKKLKKDGTLKKLSTKWLGEDYTVQN
ncbi:transporter substrate-binding domain-containing protein [Priestia megaterium]|uniref:amino acid ABC transporter substrate-binding protein n=1 Tax=Priestia megaterium TaxID=1404 RepID=UPI003CB0B858